MDLGPLMKSVGKNLSKAQLKSMMADIDADVNGNIEFPEFLSLINS